MKINHNKKNEIDLREILTTLLDYKKLIFLITLIFTIISTIYSFSLKPIYVSQLKMNSGYVNTNSDIKGSMNFFFPSVLYREIGRKYVSIETTGPSFEFTNSKLKLAIIHLIQLSNDALEFDQKNTALLLKEINILEKNFASTQDGVILARISELRIEMESKKIDYEGINVMTTNPSSYNDEIISYQVSKQKFSKIFLGFFFGFILSVFVVFFRQFFLLEKK